MIKYILMFMIALFLLIPIILFYGKRAVVRGDWTKHRHFMVTALALWALVMLLIMVQLLSHGIEGIFAPYNLLYLIYFVIAFATSLMIALTLWRVIKHQYLPHKMLARKTVYVWAGTSLLGAVLYLYGLWVMLVI